MTISKDLRFQVSARAEGVQRLRVTAPELEHIDVAVPPEFRGPGEAWSAEALLVASAASCYTVTFSALAERRRIPIHGLTVTGTGHVGLRDDGRVGFVVIELTARIQTEPEFTAAAEGVARAANSMCLVARALSVPVEVTPVVRAVEPAAA